MVHTLGLSIEFSAFEMIMMNAMPLAVAALLIWYSRLAQSKGWIA